MIQVFDDNNNIRKNCLPISYHFLVPSMTDSPHLPCPFLPKLIPGMSYLFGHDEKEVSYNQ